MPKYLAPARPTLYTEANTTGLRARFVCHSKRIDFDYVVVRGDHPESLRQVNPENVYPFLVDKTIALCAEPLNNYIHERYPSPPLLPDDICSRAYARMLWYMLRKTAKQVEAYAPEALRSIRDLESCYEPEQFWLVGKEHITIADIAAVAMLYIAHNNALWQPEGSPMQRYYEKLTNARAFQQALLAGRQTEEAISEVA